MKRALLGVAVLLCALSWGAAARAALPVCGASSTPSVQLTSQIDEASGVSESVLEDHLAAALRARGFELCRGGFSAGPQLAALHVAIIVDAAGQARATFDLGDALTNKRVDRTLRLTEFPTDARALAVASSADELLRASWAELTLVEAPPPTKPPPVEVLRAVRVSTRLVPTREPVSAELSVEGSFVAQRYRTALGARVRAAYWATPHLGLFLAPNVSTGLRRSAPHGSVGLDGMGIEGGLSYGLTPIERPLGAAVEGGLSVLRLSFLATPAANGSAHSFTDWSLMGGARLRGWWGTRVVRATLSLGAAYGLRPSRAYDGVRIVTANQGAGIETFAGLGLFF